MKTLTVRQLVNVIVTVVVIVVNILANALPLNGLNTGDISDRFAIYFVPAGYVFSIWGIIYLGLLAFTVYQALPSQRNSAFLKRTGYLYALSGVANIAWIFLWHYEVFRFTLLAMLTILGSLIAIYVRLNVGRAEVSAQERWLVHVPFSIYLGWISVATVANATQLLYSLNWGGWGIAPEVWTIVMLVIAAALALIGNLARGDVAYNLVFIWAYIGIAVKHAGTPTVSWTAWILAAVIAVMLIVRKPVLRLLRVPARA